MGKIKKALLSGAFALFCAHALTSIANSEEPPAGLLWSRTFNSGAGIFDIAWDVTTDASNSSIVSGASMGFGSGANQSDTRVVKFNGDGDIVWNKLFDSGTDDSGKSVAADGENNIYVAGYVAPPGRPGQWECRVLKLTADGGIIWDKTFSLRAGKTDCQAIAVHNSTEIYVAGILGYVANSTMTADAFLFKIDGNGELQWAQVTDKGRSDTTNTLATDEHGNAIIGGDSQAELYSGGPVRQMFMAAKAAMDGTTVFSNTYRAGLNDTYGSVTGIATDKDANVLMGGGWATSTQQGTLYVKVGPSGEEIIKEFTPRSSWMTYFAPYGEGAADSSGSLYLAGYLYNNWQSDLAFSKFSPEGTILWTQKLEQAGEGYANSLALDKQGDIYLTGLNYTSDTSGGMGGIVLAKYRPAGPSRSYVIAKSAPQEPHLVNVNAYSSPLVSLVKDTDGNPVENVELLFNISRSPDFSSGQQLSKTSERTDPQGLAGVMLKLGNIPAEYDVAAVCNSCEASANSVTFACCGKLPNDHFSQSGVPAWSPTCYANNDCQLNPNATIGWRGCALTSLATLINYYSASVYSGIPRTNPGDLNTYLRGLPNYGGYNRDNDVEFSAIGRYSSGRVSFVDRYDVDDPYSRDSLLDMADGLIRFGIPMMFRVGGPHFILVIGKCGSSFVVADPAGGREYLYDPANPPQGRPFRGLRIFSSY